MKKLYKYIVLVIGILAFSACTDETEFPSVAEEGTDVTLSLNFKLRKARGRSKYPLIPGYPNGVIRT